VFVFVFGIVNVDVNVNVVVLVRDSEESFLHCLSSVYRRERVAGE
jgi:hypothetical protein